MTTEYFVTLDFTSALNPGDWDDVLTGIEADLGGIVPTELVRPVTFGQPYTVRDGTTRLNYVVAIDTPDSIDDFELELSHTLSNVGHTPNVTIEPAEYERHPLDRNGWRNVPDIYDCGC